MVWAWMLWSAYALGTRTRLWFGHGCSGQRMLWEQERDYVPKDRRCVSSGVTRGRVTMNKPQISRRPLVPTKKSPLVEAQSPGGTALSRLRCPGKPSVLFLVGVAFRMLVGSVNQNKQSRPGEVMNRCRTFQFRSHLWSPEHGLFLTARVQCRSSTDCF